MSLNICKNVIKIFEVNLENEVIVAASAFTIASLSKESEEASNIFA